MTGNTPTEFINIQSFVPVSPWDAGRLYQECVPLIGQRVDVVAGDLVATANGPLLVSETITPESILVNKRTQSAMALTDLKIAQPYVRMKNDCVSLAARFMDQLTGTKIYTERYSRVTIREYLANLGGGAADYILSLGLVEVTNSPLEPNDIILGGLPGIPAITSHMAVYLGGNKILHHRPYKLSSIDALADADIQRIFRYAD